MSNTSITISLPEWMRESLDQQSTKAGFSNLSEYVRSLFREHLTKLAKLDLEQKLLKGLDSQSYELTPLVLQAIEDEIHRKTTPSIRVDDAA